MRIIVHLSDLHFGRVDPVILAPLLAAVTTIRPDLVVVSGDFTLLFRRGSSVPPQVRLRTSGDYAIWRGSLEHSWRAEQDSVVISIRWRDAETGEPSRGSRRLVGGGGEGA